MTERICTHPGCDRPCHSRQLCKPHYMQVRQRQKAYGRWESRQVDAQPVREHIVALKAAGVGKRRLAKLSGVGEKAISHVLIGRSDRGTGPSKRVMRTTADRILAVPIPAVPHELVADCAVVNGVGTARRLQALVAIGWPQCELGRRIGVTPPNMKPLMKGRNVIASTARRVAGLYDELSMTPGTSVRARNDARRKGWRKPLEWDDIDTDLDAPTAIPVADRIADRIAEWEHLVRGGVHPQQAATRMGVTYDAVTQWHIRAGRTPMVCRNGHKMIRPRYCADCAAEQRRGQRAS